MRHDEANGRTRTCRPLHKSEGNSNSQRPPDRLLRTGRTGIGMKQPSTNGRSRSIGTPMRELILHNHTLPVSSDIRLPDVHSRLKAKSIQYTLNFVANAGNNRQSLESLSFITSGGMTWDACHTPRVAPSKNDWIMRTTNSCWSARNSG